MYMRLQPARKRRMRVKPVRQELRKSSSSTCYMSVVEPGRPVRARFSCLALLLLKRRHTGREPR
jgi:hypothetical protein